MEALAGLWLVMDRALHPTGERMLCHPQQGRKWESKRRPRDQTPQVRPLHKGTNQFPSSVLITQHPPYPNALRMISQHRTSEEHIQIRSLPYTMSV